MNFALLWVELLLIVLLWVAAWGAWIGRVRAGWVRGWLWGIVGLVPLLASVSIMAVASLVKFGLGLERNWFYYFVSLLAAYLLGAVVILIRGGRKQAEGRPAAASWRAGGLTLAWVLAVVMGGITLENMDLAARARYALLSVKVDALYLASMPAIVSEDQNAALIYEQAFAKLKDGVPEDISNPPFGCNKTFDPKEPATLAFLKRQEPTIGLLRQATAKPACRFDADLADPEYDQPLAGLGQEWNAASLLGLHARQMVAEGEVAEAIADAAAILRMSRHFARRPTLVAGLVGLRVDALGVETLETVLPRVKRPEELAGLRLDKLTSLNRAFQQSLRGEERMGLMMYRGMPEGLRHHPDGAVTIANMPLMGSGTNLGAAWFRVFYLNVNAYAGMMKQMQDWAVEPYHQIRDQLPSADQWRTKDLFLSILSPSLPQTMKVLARSEAGDQCARIAVAMTRFRLEHGALPKRLEDLVPQYLDAIPADPFNGKPLKVAVKGEGRVIYSVGPEGVDDGGVEISWKKQKGDVIFTLKAGQAGAASRGPTGP